MKRSKNFITYLSVLLLMSQLFSCLWAGDGMDVSVSADFVSRYVWRGIPVNDAANIQPAITFEYENLGFGLWGSSALSKVTGDECDYALSQEVDFWAEYGFEFGSGMSLSAIITDYYFPHAGVEFSNFNNYDDEDGAGAHIVEIGGTFSGPEALPVNLSAYMNIHNDEGDNVYFQLDHSRMIGNTAMDLFLGAAAGSEDNPDYYGAEEFELINVGLTASRTIPVTDQFALPVFVSWIVNPNTDVSFLTFGFSL